MDERILYVTRKLTGAPVAENPPPRQFYTIQRRGARVRLQTGAPAKLHFWEVTLIDISRSGALIEHAHRVRVAEVYHLRFQLDDLHVGVVARAVRGFVSHLAPVAGGERQIVYRTGMEFIELTDDTAEVISAYIDRVCKSLSTP